MELLILFLYLLFLDILLIPDIWGFWAEKDLYKDKSIPGEFFIFESISEEMSSFFSESSKFSFTSEKSSKS